MLLRLTQLSAIGVICLIVFAACSGDPRSSAAVSSPSASEVPLPILHDFNSVDDFKEAFNNYSGKPRLILLLSPT